MRFFGEGAVLLVDPEPVRLVVVGEEDVRPVVAVEVRADHPQPRPGELRQPRGDRDVLEQRPVRLFRPAAQVVVEARDEGAEGVGVAVILFPVPRAAPLRRVEIDVIDDDEVEPPVAVVVHERRRCSPHRVIDPRLFGDVLELAPAEVQEQPGPPVPCEADIDQPVVVHVADCHAHAVPGDVEPRAAGRETSTNFPSSVLPRQSVGGLGVGEPLRDRRSGRDRRRVGRRCRNPERRRRTPWIWGIQELIGRPWTRVVREGSARDPWSRLPMNHGGE